MAAGAGIAIEDSIVLAGLLQSSQSVTQTLQSFMTRRFDKRCRLVVENSFMLGEWGKTSRRRPHWGAGPKSKSTSPTVLNYNYEQARETMPTLLVTVEAVILYGP
jgi:hypothetical protein